MSHTALSMGLCLYSAPHTYVDEAGVGHDVLHLYTAGHTLTGTPTTDGDWPAGFDLWDLVDTDESGEVVVDSAPFAGQWRAGRARVITLRDGLRWLSG
ncbi:hypothetical protein [Streptomyces sp. HUAS TT7]|uniref:hypothetical protein n=1 Tax=Streptomyces sp. HUAS TT7 TaxID=3447507 RepID=UPI003F65C0F0